MMKQNIQGDAEFIKMTETPIPKLVASLSVPTVCSQMITSVYNMADTYFVSTLGESASGAVGVVFAMQSIIQAVGFGLAMGAGSIVSRKLGGKDNRRASIIASSALFSAIICGFLLLLTFVVDLNGMLKLFGSTETILPFAHDYALYIVLAAPLMCSSFVLNNLLKAEGKAMFSMIGLTAGGIINIILDPLFIYIFKGIAGASIATAVSQAISFAILLMFYISGKSIVKISFKNISRQFSDYVLIVKTGLPTVFRQGLGSLSTVLLNRQVKAYSMGDNAMAAVSIANKVYMLLRNLILGIGQGFQPVAGYNYGAKKNDRVKKAFYVSVIFGTVVSVVSSLILLIFPQQIIGIFKPESAETVEMGRKMLMYLGTAIPVLGFSTYVNQLYQSLGFVKSASLLASCRQGICFIPLIFILPALLGLDGILMTQGLADILTFIISIPFCVFFLHRVLRKENSDALRKN